MSMADQTITATDADRREAAVRRALRRTGHALRKLRARNLTLDNQGGYMILDPHTNTIVAGERYDLTLDNVERLAVAA